MKNTTIKIIDNKKIALTPDELAMYVSICKSYDRPNFQGSDLFKDLFETDNDGIITFIKPPSTKYTSMEVFLFICSIMQNQQLRIMREQVDDMCENLKKQVNEFIKNNK